MAPADLSITPARADASHGISRRRVLVGTAWATPAILVGVAAPQAAASGGSGTSPDGTMSLGSGQVQSGNNNGSRTFDIQYLPVLYAGGGFPAAVTLAFVFPKTAVAVPVIYRTSSPYGWVTSVREGTSTVELVFTKDPNVSFQYSIPGIQGWIQAAPGFSGSLSVPWYATGTSSTPGPIVSPAGATVTFPA